jgi:hypothetical protein
MVGVNQFGSITFTSFIFAFNGASLIRVSCVLSLLPVQPKATIFPFTFTFARNSQKKKKKKKKQNLKLKLKKIYEETTSRIPVAGTTIRK